MDFTWVISLLALSGIILFHEFGHFLFARLNGVTVVEFSMGFGPRLLSYVSKKSGTRYSVKCLPFGGSCAMLGEPGEEETEEEGSFFSKSPLARISIIAAGPVFNFILAFLFAIVILSWAGYDSPAILGVTEGKAAEAAGLEAGDVITKLGNRSVHLARDISMYTMVSPGDPVLVTYRRFSEADQTWETKQAVLDLGAYAAEGGPYYLGIQLSSLRTPVESIPKLLEYGVYEVRFWIRSVLDSLGMIGKGRVSGEDIAGPVRIVTIMDDTVRDTSQYGFVAVLMNVLNLMIMFSANLGVMNLLPLPALDGGRLVFLIWELVTGRPVNQRIENAVTMAGMALLMTLMVFVVVNDVRNLF